MSDEVPGAYNDTEFAALYDLFFSDHEADLGMYEQFARRGETASLELGVGTGRVALHLARAGLSVVGLDSSLAMLARLEAALDAETSRRLRLVEGDMRSFQMSDRFDLIYCAANSFQHLLATDEQVSALRCVAAHLAPGGLFVTDVFPLSWIDWTVERPRMQFRGVRTDPATGEQIMRIDAPAADPATQITTPTYIFDRMAADGAVRRRWFQFQLRCMGRAEWELVLEKAGLRLSQLYGSFDLSPFDQDSDKMIIVATLP